jgi:hypothetical protein
MVRSRRPSISDENGHSMWFRLIVTHPFSRAERCHAHCLPVTIGFTGGNYELLSQSGTSGHSGLSPKPKPEAETPKPKLGGEPQIGKPHFTGDRAHRGDPGPLAPLIENELNRERHGRPRLTPEPPRRFLVSIAATSHPAFPLRYPFCNSHFVLTERCVVQTARSSYVQVS